MNYEKWYDTNEEELHMECAESGADRELDFNFDDFCESKYEEYLVDLYKENKENKKLVHKYKNFIESIYKTPAGKIIMNQLGYNKTYFK